MRVKVSRGRHTVYCGFGLVFSIGLVGGEEVVVDGAVGGSRHLGRRSHGKDSRGKRRLGDGD